MLGMGFTTSTIATTYHAITLIALGGLLVMGIILLELSKREERAILALAEALRNLLLFLEGPTPTTIAIQQLQGGSTMAITGIVLGATGTFQEVPSPAGSAFPAGTTFTWTSGDSLTTLTPSGDTTQVAVATSASDPATSFTLTCTSSTGVVGTASVPLLPAVVGAPTSITINQLS